MNLLQRIIDLGADADVISAVAMLLAESAAVEKRRASDRDRQQAKRERDAASRDVTLCHGEKESTPPKEYIQTPHAKKKTPLTPQFDFVGVWNEMAIPAGVHTCKALSRQRNAALRSRLDEVGETEMRRAILAVGQSAFCKGDNDRGWKAGPDFVLQEKTLTKLLEGQYSNFKASSPANDRQAFLDKKYGNTAT